MKICIVNTWRGGAVHNVMYPLFEELNTYKDVECDYVTLRGIEQDITYDKSFSEYDLVHFGYFGNVQKFANEIEVPFTMGVHHMPHKHVDTYIGAMRVWGPRHIVVPEKFVLRQLGQNGICDVTLIPYAFDHSRYLYTNLPKDFTVGYLGCDYAVKRFSFIEQAAKIANVKCIGLGRDTTNEEEKYEEDEKIANFYNDISCYVVASFDDGGPLPPQEAMLCGRPVATTHVGMMDSVVIPGVLGEFHNGTPTDMARAITDIKENVEKYHKNLEMSRRNEMLLPQVKDMTKVWHEMFQRVLEEDE